VSGDDYLERFDAGHSELADRFIAIGAVRRGVVLVVWTERDEDVMRITVHAGQRVVDNGCTRSSWSNTMTEKITELGESDFASAIPARVRRRLMQGRFESGKDIVALRRFVRMTQVQLAQAMGISVHTLRNWEQDRRKPEGPAIALLRIAARHPRILRENLEPAV